MVELGAFLIYNSSMIWIALVEIGLGVIAFYIADWFGAHTKIPQWIIDSVVIIFAIVASYFAISCLTIGFSLL